MNVHGGDFVFVDFLEEDFSYRIGEKPFDLMLAVAGQTHLSCGASSLKATMLSQILKFILAITVVGYQKIGSAFPRSKKVGLSISLMRQNGRMEGLMHDNVLI